ncbi:hypothetical protein [Natrinema salifodinae]|uniref:Uncharacterized protein n=1 Tax=Natrinema salifodinae TaxID=1202768 RepID=A0A1I0NJ90_9EURY|nr:hypothetical protein [Natrinema salifodinae]SEW01230.1 hypothetical protein SAMN05216285_1772 [Natrinema salifodinae]
MRSWLRGLEWFAGELLSFLGFLLPVLATFAAVFLGVYLNGVVDRERKREMKIFRPLLDETGEVKDASASKPIRSLIEDGEHRSVLLDVRPVEFHTMDQTTRKELMAYLKAVGRLAELDDPTLAASAVLHESGYGKHFTEQLPSDMLLKPDEGIQSEKSISGPGPHIVSGRRTVISGPNAVLPSRSTKVSSDARQPLLPILVENASLLIELDSGAELRAVFESHTDIDVGYLDEQCPNWADELWKTLQRPWKGEPINYEDGLASNDKSSDDKSQHIVKGEDFRGVLTSAGIALQLRRMKQRYQVINHAEQLHGQLLVRLSRPLYHPKRILLARH